MSRFALRLFTKARSIAPVFTRTVTPVISKCQVGNMAYITTRSFSSQIDRQFTEVLSNEIKQEKEQSYSCNPPKGFSVAKKEGTEIVLQRDYNDGVCVQVEINLAGSVNPDFSEDEEETSVGDRKEENSVLEARPDIRIRLQKPSGKSVIFNCSLPSRQTHQQLNSEEEKNLPTYSVDSVEMESLPGYFVYTDLFDDNMYDHTMQLLMERQLDAQFQGELQEFCTSEEHKMYLKFLDEFHAYCMN